jgi:hypothetical protein
VSAGEFAGGAEARLRDTARRMRAAVADAQARDWVAERPDRVGWARLAQAQFHVGAAADRFGQPLPIDDWVAPLTGIGVWIGAAAILLLVAGDPADPLDLAGAIAAGAVLSQAAVATLLRFRRRRARLAPAGPAPIDDPYLFAELTQRIEGGAAAARGAGRRAAADDLDQSLDWLAAARDSLTSG